MAQLFGTDGVRGLANSELTAPLAYHLGQAAVEFLGPNVLVGKDTRISGDMLEAAVVAGITSAGGHAFLAGVIPTPAVAFLVREGLSGPDEAPVNFDGGIVISASHNPPAYNGIKFFDGQGYKLPDEKEAQLEAFVMAGGLEAMAETGSYMCCNGDYCSMVPAKTTLVAGDAVGTVHTMEDAQERYIAHAVKTVADQGIDFSALSIAVDAGHGAAFATTPEALRRLGATVHVINDDFSGTDINVKCGSTHLDALAAFMEQTGATVGIAHDGDADRVMLMAPDGSIIDGDFMAATLALDMKERGALADNTVVSTVMCNLGFVKAMEAAGIAVEQTAVGDRYVLEKMRERNLNIGGEQSGHMILLDYNSTGDGLVTAAQYLAAALRRGGDLIKESQVMRRFPQVLINVRVADKSGWEENSAIANAVAEGESALGDNGRVLVRASGTEPLIRVMVEAATEEEAKSVAQSIAEVVESELI